MKVVGEIGDISLTFDVWALRAGVTLRLFRISIADVRFPIEA